MLTQHCIPPGSLNQVPVSAGVRAGMLPLSDGRYHRVISYGVWVPVAVWRLSELLHLCYLLTVTISVALFSTRAGSTFIAGQFKQWPRPICYCIVDKAVSVVSVFPIGLRCCVHCQCNLVWCRQKYTTRTNKQQTDTHTRAFQFAIRFVMRIDSFSNNIGLSIH